MRLARLAAPLTGAWLAATVASAAGAQAVSAGGSIEARAGYGSNPYLQLNSPGGSAIAGGTLTGWLQRRTQVSRTRLTGVIDVDQNFSNYGRAENYLVSLSHRQSFSAKLIGDADLRVQDSINPRNFSDLGGTNVDLLSVGQRSRTIGGSATLQWTPTTRDNFYIGPSFTHTTYPGTSLSDFTQYGLRGGYLRQINEKLKVGIDLGVQHVQSRGFPDSNSYSVNARLVYDFSAIWEFDGTAGLIHQVTSGGGGSATTPGFSARLCGKYPRYRLCVEAARQSAASGLGGLRTDNRVHVTFDYDLTPKSRLNLGALYDVSNSSGRSIIPRQKFAELTAGYSRDLSDRLSAGASGRYQMRDYGALATAGGFADGNVSGYALTFNVVYRFGRLE